MGHQVGDEVLATVGDRLKKIFNNDFIVGRLGGDEFMVFSTHIHSPTDIETWSKEIKDRLRVEIGAILVSASIGVCFNQTGNQSFVDMYACADRSLYKTKNHNKGQYEIVIK